MNKGKDEKRGELTEDVNEAVLISLRETALKGNTAAAKASNVRQVIRARLDSGRMSVSLLARLTGFGQPHLSNFIHGHRRLSIESLSRILIALELNLEVSPKTKA